MTLNNKRDCQTQNWFNNGSDSFSLFFLLLFLYTEFTSDISQDSVSKILCFHGNMSSMFLNYSRTVFKNNCS